MKNQYHYAEAITQTWSSWLMGSLKTVLIGITLFLTAFVVLWWNEDRAVKTVSEPKEQKNQVIEAEATHVNALNSGKLIHLSGKITTDEVLRDEAFDIEVNALKLRRIVSMYQWVEIVDEKTEKKIVGGNATATYDYKKEWTSKLIRSSDFKVTEGHINPASFPYPSLTQQASAATLGKYQVSNSLVGEIDDFDPFSVNKLDISKIKNASLLNEGSTNVSNGITLVSKVYIGNGTNGSPQIGDVKVSFEIVRVNSECSVVAMQRGNILEKINATNVASIEMISPVPHSTEKAFVSTQKNNSFITWILRGVGLIMMFFGLSIMFKPIVAMADVLPVLGGVLDNNLSVFSGLSAFALSLVTIAVAWLAHKPAVSIVLVLMGIGAFVFFYLKSPKKKMIVGLNVY